MKNKRPLVLLLLAYCLAQPAFGQVWFGVRDCGQWIERLGGTSRVEQITSEGWLAGFMSGLNWMYWLNHKDTGDPLSKVNSQAQMVLWMDNYCNKNPLNIVSQGGVDLFTELRDK